MTYTDALTEAAKTAEGCLVAGITEAGVTYIMVEDCKVVYEFGEDRGLLLGPRMIDITLATPEQIESSRRLEAKRIADENRKPVRRYRRY